MAVKKQSAGILVYRQAPKEVEVLLGHYGGPFWAKKDLGAWTMPKGEFKDGESALQTARREFEEETGIPVPDGELIDLGEAKRPGKTFTIWAMEAELNPAGFTSNTAEIEWPPRSGNKMEIPEIDKFIYFPLSAATKKIHPNLLPFLLRLAEKLGLKLDEPEPEVKQASLF